MKDEAFAQLVKSIKQASEIQRGELQPSRVFEFSPLDVKAIRAKLQKSQSEFAQMIGVSVATLQNWEQGRRKPEGPARALLQVALYDPEAVQKALAMTYRAIHRNGQAAGATPSAALDALEDLLPDDAGTLVILQKFKPDVHFGTEQQARLAELMGQLQAARAQGYDLAPQTIAELEALINLELQSTVLRSEAMDSQAMDR
jgi:putative transcriptional regulator